MAIFPPWLRSAPSDGLAEVRAKTKGLQSDASDPAASAWVSANAGTGKTHVLTMRVLRLLLAGTAPERILALTYTKAAAAEMSKRVFAKLAEWVTDSDATLAGKLFEIMGRAASADEMRLSRRLFAIAIETPGGLKVQTIHAFCERLLQRFSLEADVPPGFAILDDQEKAELLSEAMDAVLREATAPGSEDTALARALRRAVGFASEHAFEELLAEALNARDWIGPADTDEACDATLTRAARIYAELFQIAPGATLAAIEADMEAVMARPDLERAKAILATGTTNDQKAAQRIDKVLRANGPIARIPALCDVFLTSGKKRVNLMTQSLADKHPELCRRLEDACERISDLEGRRARVQAYDASLVLLALARRAMAHYRHAKEQRAALDFDDLVAKAAGLLQTSSAVEWVLYKLDGGLDHILVDEAQDTAPLQWHVVKALALEFFSGLGTGEGRPRTLFAVGDEKQSIYGFQGAAPGMFRQTGNDFRQRAEAAGMTWQPVPLSLSFRSAAPILQAVDLVFADPSRTPGVGSGRILHIAHRAGHAGLVEVWPLEGPDQQADTSQPWEPLSSPATTKPSARLAARIADTISGWLAQGEKLASEDRPIRSGDILILVLKRTPFAPVMVSALKARGIPVAGADRLILTDEIAVQDLVALGQVIVLPEDDLSLASLLKSPLFGLDDDDLLRLAPGRSGSLWQALQQDAASAETSRDALETLLRWRGMATHLPPYEFYAALLDGEGQRARMLARLGPDASDPIDEFLNRALAFGEHAPPTLQGFLTSLGQGRHEIKRDMEQGRDEVRVMTVHGAKGLEAPIVFLPDTCHTKGGRVGGTLLQSAGGAGSAREPTPFLWPVRGTSRVEAIAAARAARALSDTEERNRLLYVAMTRPRDRLYVAGFRQTDTKLAEDCWYELIHAALKGAAVEQADGGGRPPHLVLSSEQAAKPHVAGPREAAAPTVGPPPAWASRPASIEPLLTVPLSPSRLAPLEMEAGDATKPKKASKAADRRPREPAILPPAILADEARFLRGTLTHALLEHLPTLPAARQETSARAFLAAQAARLSAGARDGIVRETLAILRHPAFAPLFGPDSRAEVALSAEIPRPRGQAGPALRLAGKIDRLVRDGNTVLIVDYKTNRPPPDDASKVADAYLLQLAAYRLAVQSIFPKCTVRSAILWTDGPRIMEIAPQTLDAYASKLWELDTAVLDA